ncbi:MAG: maleylpyruvate isomerase family mycothiol-dependent enzyme [Gordonia amarae]
MTDLTGLSPADRHRVVAAGFAEQVAATEDWSAPTAVDGWVALDVVRHLIDWLPGFLAAGGIELSPTGSVDDDPAAAWASRSEAIQRLLDGPDAASEFTHPMVGTHVLTDAIDSFYTADVFMHTWDLASASGRESGLDPAFAEQLLTGMAGIEGMLRASGQYGPAVEVPADAGAVDKLMGFIGRDPGR